MQVYKKAYDRYHDAMRPGDRRVFKREPGNRPFFKG
jgi:hypothetical protein